MIMICAFVFPKEMLCLWLLLVRVLCIDGIESFVISLFYFLTESSVILERMGVNVYTWITYWEVVHVKSYKTFFFLSEHRIIRNIGEDGVFLVRPGENNTKVCATLPFYFLATYKKFYH